MHDKETEDQENCLLRKERSNTTNLIEGHIVAIASAKPCNLHGLHRSASNPSIVSDRS